MELSLLKTNRLLKERRGSDKEEVGFQFDGRHVC